MTFIFDKYHGTCNDFVIADNRNGDYNGLTQAQIEFLCDRRRGVGADGLILLEESADTDFKMVYFNSDGNQSTMCGNGGRCIVMYAHSKGIIGEACSFMAIDGLHEASVKDGVVKLKMTDVAKIEKHDDDYVLDTGSPHYVQFVNNVSAIDVHDQGAYIRYSKAFKKAGINVNFVQPKSQSIQVGTYERGVEAETYSCGTGVVASAIAANVFDPKDHTSPQAIETKGGDLKVYYTKTADGYQDIYLEGPAVKVFSGELTLSSHNEGT